MEGRCPGCQRAYDISDDFLGMGGKAKCPHCMLELEFAQQEDSRDKTEGKVVTRDGGPDEVDSHCPSCDRRFKVDRDYLEMGNQAKCPHCAVDLEFDAPAVDHDKLLSDLADELAQPDEMGADLEDQEVLAQASRGLDDLPSLDDEELDDDDLSFSDEIEEQEPDGEKDQQALDPDDLDASSPTTAEIPSRQAEQPDVDQDEFGEEPSEETDEFSEKTDLLPDTRPDHRLMEDEPEEFEQEEEEEEWDEERDEQDQVLVDAPDDELDQGEDYDDSEERPTVALFGNQQPGDQTDSGGVFSGLATSRDWASAAAEWAESGFKAEDMPRFIQDQPAAEDADQPQERDEQDPEPTDEPEAAVGSRDDISAVEVSDADIMVPEQLMPLDEDSEEGEFPEEPTFPEEKKPSPFAKREPTEPVIRDPKAKRAAQKAVAREKAKKKKPKPKERAPSRLKSPMVWVPLAVGLVVVAVVLYFVFSSGGEDPSTAKFSTEGLPVAMVEAPAPSDYSAKDDALEHYGQGNQYAYNGHLEDAVREYQQALRIDPGYPHPHRALGAVYAALGKSKLSRSEYETYLKLAPKSADAKQVQTIIDSYDEKKEEE